VARRLAGHVVRLARSGRMALPRLTPPGSLGAVPGKSSGRHTRPRGLPTLPTRHAIVGDRQ
jgi:hypothetical protein